MTLAIQPHTYQAVELLPMKCTSKASGRSSFILSLLSPSPHTIAVVCPVRSVSWWTIAPWKKSVFKVPTWNETSCPSAAKAPKPTTLRCNPTSGAGSEYTLSCPTFGITIILPASAADKVSVAVSVWTFTSLYFNWVKPYFALLIR